MKYCSDTFYIEALNKKDALLLNKLFVKNTERFQSYLPTTLAENATLDSTLSYIDRKTEAMHSKKEYIYTIKDKTTGDVAGIIILKALDWVTKQGEFAYCICENYAGKGWMSEAIVATSKHALETLNLEKLQIIAHKENFASIKVAVNSGFTWKKTLQNEFTPLNKAPLDMELYELQHER